MMETKLERTDGPKVNDNNEGGEKPNELNESFPARGPDSTPNAAEKEYAKALEADDTFKEAPRPAQGAELYESSFPPASQEVAADYSKALNDSGSGGSSGPSEGWADLKGPSIDREAEVKQIQADKPADQPNN